MISYKDRITNEKVEENESHMAIWRAPGDSKEKKLKMVWTHKKKQRTTNDNLTRGSPGKEGEAKTQKAVGRQKELDGS